MSNGFSPDIKVIRSLPPLWVAVRSGEKDQHLGVRRNLDSANLGSVGRRPEEPDGRRLEPQCFVERASRQARILPQQIPLVGIADECSDGERNAVDRGVDPGRQERSHQQAAFASLISPALTAV
jgi:hypothetical protein